MPNPSTYGGFCHLLKISLDNPYLKIIDLPKLFCGCPYEKILTKIVLPLLRALDQEQSKIRFFTSYVHKLTIQR